MPAPVSASLEMVTSCEHSADRLRFLVAQVKHFSHAVCAHFLSLHHCFISSAEFLSLIDFAKYVAKTYYDHYSQHSVNIFPSLSTVFNFDFLFSGGAKFLIT